MTDAPLPSPSSPIVPFADRDWFVRSGDWVIRGAIVLGALRGLHQLADFAAAPFDGLATFLAVAASVGADALGCWLVGLTVAALVRALGVWADSTTRSQRGAGSATERPIVSNGDGRSFGDESGPAAGVRLAEIRRLIREGVWAEAGEAVQAFRSESPNDPRGAELADALETARRGAFERLEAELKAARSVNDPEQAMEIHSRMQVLIDGETRDGLDADLARWFLLIVHRRLRGGRIQTEVVELADRVAGRFGHTKEGASLRAALPTLRRSAGLCPRCGKPFVGNADACPECLGGPPPLAPTVPVEDADADEEALVERTEPDWYTEPSDESAA